MKTDKPIEKKEEKDIFKDLPWKSLDEYYYLVTKHHMGGKDLKLLLLKREKEEAKAIVKARGKVIKGRGEYIPTPTIKPI